MRLLVHNNALVLLASQASLLASTVFYLDGGTWLLLSGISLFLLVAGVVCEHVHSRADGVGRRARWPVGLPTIALAWIAVALLLVLLPEEWRTLAVAVLALVNLVGFGIIWLRVPPGATCPLCHRGRTGDESPDADGEPVQ